MIKAPKKLIEVALPLDDINEASSREKSIRHGHPSTLHLWWARRPLAAARAVLFAQLVNDPGGERGWGKYPGQTKEDALKERERLFGIIRQLVKWENTNNEELLDIAREEIRKSWRETCELNKGKSGYDPEKLPPFHDPFAGGGSIPLEAQRLGLEAYATDLNPVAVMINKAMLEFPPQFNGKKPIGPLSGNNYADTNISEYWHGSIGLAEDVRRYGNWILNKAKQKIGNLYPDLIITKDMAKIQPNLNSLVGEKLEIITWLWTRTVKSPNPAYSDNYVPIMKSFVVSKNKNAWIDFEIKEKSYDFKLCFGKNGPKYKSTIGRGGGICILSGSPISLKYIREEGLKGNLKVKLFCVVAKDKDGKKLFLDSRLLPLTDSVDVDPPRGEILHWPGCTNVVVYGMNKFSDLFLNRQIAALNTFSNLISEAYEKSLQDCKKNGYDNNYAEQYAKSIALYMTCALGRSIDYWNSLTSWENGGEFVAHAFTKHALPMIWDFCEVNPLADAGGSWQSAIDWVSRVIEKLPAIGIGHVSQSDAASKSVIDQCVISTDPPYYDNVPYSNLSDFFYIWERLALKNFFPDLFSTIQTPKHSEIVASHSLFDKPVDAMNHFTSKIEDALKGIAVSSIDSIPITIYYAFKQSNSGSEGTLSIGWESFLSSVIKSGLMIVGTWPIHTERTTRGRAIGSNALASSIVLVCRKKDNSAQSITRRQFLKELKTELPESLEAMIGGAIGVSPIAPVDLAQSAIGPGMAVFSRYSGIIESDGSFLTVHDALLLINKVIDEYFNEVEGDMDSDTRFCIDWFMQYGFKQSEYGQADVLARAKGTTVDGLADAGVVETGAGKVRLLKFEEYQDNWDPDKDGRTPTWEALHQLIRALRTGGEEEAGLLLKKMSEKAESIRQLAYRLYTLCERKGWAEEARAYNELIASWHGTIEAAEKIQATSRQGKHLKLNI